MRINLFLSTGVAVCLLLLGGCTANSANTPMIDTSPEVTASEMPSIPAIPTRGSTPVPLPTEAGTAVSDDQLAATLTQGPPNVRLTALHQWTLPRWYVFDIEWPPSSDMFIIAKDEVKLYDVARFEELWNFQPAVRADRPSGAKFGLDGRSLYLYDRGWGLQIRDPDTGELIRDSRDEPYTFGSCLQSDAEDVVWAPYGDSLFISIEDDLAQAAIFTEIHLWNTLNLKCQEIFARTHGSKGILDVSSDGRYLALGTLLEVSEEENSGRDIEFGQVLVWELETLNHRQICTVGDGSFARFRPGTTMLASPDPEHDGIAFWDVETCQIVNQISEVPAPYDLAFSPDGDLLITVLDRIWVLDSDTGEILLEVEHPSLSESRSFDQRQNSLTISPDGHYLLSYAVKPPDQSTLVLWEIER